ncbi:MAG TPA: glycogen synthase GlgA [Candidatus Binatia bacterium]
MKIGAISSEISPFAKTGGLADVVGSLSTALEQLGHELCLIMPAYRSTLQGGFALRNVSLDVSVPLSDRQETATILKTKLGRDVIVYLVRADRYFNREFLYGTKQGNYADNLARFVFLTRNALEILRHERVDIIHCHDWQTALAPVFLRTQPLRYPELASAKTVLTVHNIAFQGNFWRADWHYLNLDEYLFSPAYLEFYQNFSLLKGGLIFADKITTVSPTHAAEIRTKEQGFGLEGVLQQRANDLIGILNGIDYNQWNPAVDPVIAKQYSVNDLDGKRFCKDSLQRAMGLAIKPDVPLFGIISRLTSQKGIDLIEQIFSALIERDVQFVLLGTGDSRYEDFFTNAAAQFPGKVGVRIGFDESLAHQIEAGADIFLMPSLFEPCGLNQMFSLKYGTIPLVRAVGGLKDTVQNYNAERSEGTGFVFEAYEAQELLETIDRALKLFPDKKSWTALQRRAMSMDFSWDRSAKAYSRIYHELLA